MILTSLTLLSAFYCACSAYNGKSSVTKTGLFYDTVVTVEVFGSDTGSLETVASNCIGLCDHYQKLFDPDIETSDISKINDSGSETVDVDHDTDVMISEALKYSDLSNGKFDI